MAGLDLEGFVPKTFQEISDTISNKLKVINPNFDTSPESPDGQLINIMSLEISQAWNELNLVYRSYDPEQAVGAGLRNLGLITGIPYGAATRSRAFINLVGTAGTTVPKGAIVTDVDDNEFFTSFQAIIPSAVEVQSGISGKIPVGIGAINTIKSPILGWDSINQTLAGKEGNLAQSELEFRNIRNRTVMRNFVGIADTIRSRLLELGLEQVTVLSNDTGTPLTDGTPPQSIHVTMGPVVGVTDEDIATSILNTKGLGTLTYGNDSVSVADSQGNSHLVNFTKATPVPIYVSMDITFLSSDFAGAVENITKDIANSINSLSTSEDVIWSRLFTSITKYGKAQVNSLFIGKTASPTSTANIFIATTEFAVISDIDINIVVTS